MVASFLPLDNPDFLRSEAVELIDKVVDFVHDADGLTQGDNDFPVMFDAFIGEDPSATVLDPFVADLVSKIL
jgi:hypothetical protein